MRFIRYSWILGLVLLLLLSFSVGAWAQAGTGEITGIVTDPSGAVVPRADVTLLSVATGITRTTQTTTAGIYTFPSLPVVGTYTLTVKAQGFRDFQIGGLVASVGTTLTQDVHLLVGAAKETVTVEATPQMVQTTESQVSALIDHRVWEQFPLEVRNQNSFIELAAGAVPDKENMGNTRGAAVNGARGGAGNYMVEGVDNNDQGQGGRGQLSTYDAGGAVTSISPDAIQEYRVITNSFAAEYGKAGGFVTDTVLKSGTNTWHGSLYEYNRIQALAANSFFSNRTIDETTGKKLQDHLVRNQFGGTLGGPVIKDKTFFYLGAEIHRARQGQPLHAVGTTQDFLNWVDSGGLQRWAESSPDGVCMQELGAACPGAFAASGHLGSTFKKMVGVGPFPLAPTTSFATNPANYTGGGYWTQDLTYPVPIFGDVYVQNPYFLNEYRISAKFDHKLTDKDQLNALFLLQDGDSGDVYGGGGGDIGPASLNQGRSTNVALNWTRTLSNTVINTAKISYLRHVSNYPSPDPAYNTMPMIATYYDSLTVGLGLYSGLPQYFTDNQYQIQDHLSFVRGKHSFKTGVEYRRIKNGSRFFNDRAGTFYPYGTEDLVTDLNFSDEAGIILGRQRGSVYSASASVDSTTGQLPDYYRGFRANEMAAYFQDDWRIHPRFTLNWGLRFEYFGPPHNYKPNIDSNFYFGNVTTPITTTSTNPYFPKNTPFYAGVATGNFQIRNNEIWNKDTNNFGPRLGFAWDIFGDQKLVMRAGAGFMFDRIYNNVFENIRFNPPYFSDNQIGYTANGNAFGAIVTPGIYAYPFTATSSFNNPIYAPKPNPRHMDQNLVSPYYEQMHLGFQWEFAKGYVFEPRYVGTFGHKLIGYYDINTFDGRVSCPVVTTPYAATSACARAGYPLGFNTTRINNNIGADNYRANRFASNYHSMQMEVRKNFTSGLGFNASYTWSKTLDTLSDLFQYRAGAAASGAAVTDSMNTGYDYGPADFDMRHRFVGSVAYDLPFFKDNRWAGGWAVNAIVSLQSGVPFSPYSSASSYDLNKDGRYFDRVVPVAGVSSMGTLTGGSPANGYINTAQWQRYSCPASANGGLWCNAPIGRNSVYGPSFQNFDFNVSKKFKVTEKVAMSLQANFFNLFNRANFEPPQQNMNSATFGKSTATYDPRITQLALRLDF